mgnify:CR=1 FL=1
MHALVVDDYAYAQGRDWWSRWVVRRDIACSGSSLSALSTAALSALSLVWSRRIKTKGN